MVVVRPIVGAGVAAERELSNAHPRKTAIVTQLFHFMGDDSQIFGDDWQFPQRVANGLEQFPARRFDPMAAFGSLVAARNLPAGDKAAKMIDTHNVDCLQSRFNSFDPPGKAIGQHSLPVVERISPQLSSLAEIIRWYTGHNHGRPIRIKLELIRVGPNVCGIMRYKNRNVADDLYTSVIAVAFEIEPLSEEKKLIKLLGFDLLT